jgi:hypothetical protein
MTTACSARRSSRETLVEKGSTLILSADPRPCSEVPMVKLRCRRWTFLPSMSAMTPIVVKAGARAVARISLLTRIGSGARSR